MARALILLALLASVAGCYSVSAAGIRDCKEKGCAWNEATARCECAALRPGGPFLRDIPGKLEGQ